MIGPRLPLTTNRNSKSDLLCVYTDVDVDEPDERSVMTYVAKFLVKYPKRDSSFPDSAEVSDFPVNIVRCINVLTHLLSYLLT